MWVLCAYIYIMNILTYAPRSPDTVKMCAMFKARSGAHIVLSRLRERLTKLTRTKWSKCSRWRCRGRHQRHTVGSSGSGSSGIEEGTECVVGGDLRCSRNSATKWAFHIFARNSSEGCQAIFTNAVATWKNLGNMNARRSSKMIHAYWTVHQRSRQLVLDLARENSEKLPERREHLSHLEPALQIAC